MVSCILNGTLYNYNWPVTWKDDDEKEEEEMMIFRDTFSSF